MGRLSDKYIAGFLDSDGSIGLQIAPKRAAMIRIRFSQHGRGKDILESIHQVYGGSFSVRTLFNKTEGCNIDYYELGLSRKLSKIMLNRLKKFLVVRRRFADFALSFDGTYIEADQVEATKVLIKNERKIESLPIPKHPTRGWAAGYIDGDGCFDVRVNNHAHYSCSPRLRITAIEYNTEGIEVLQKYYGGTLAPMNKKNPHIIVWTLALPTSKVKELYNDLERHLVAKHDQLCFLKGCADMGHYRDGRNIKSIMTDLKVSQQRLSDSGHKLPLLLQQVKDLRKGWWK